MASNAQDQGGLERKRRVEPARVVNSNHAAVNGCWRNLGIGFGRNPPDASAAIDYRATLEHVVQQNRGRVGLLTIIEADSTPTPEGRDIMVKMFRELWQHLAGAAFVVRGQGFAAATQRSILSAFLMASGLRSRLRIYSSLEDAVPWLAHCLIEGHPRMTEEDLAETILEIVNAFVAEHSE